jgi:phytoene dehydrogenase-like protein
MRIGIIGAGLGGLLAGLGLLRAGCNVTIFEGLPYPGGRFTNLEYRGFQLSTGALHMIPHARRGPLGRMLKDLGMDVEILESRPDARIRVGARDLTFNEIPGLFSPREKIRLTALLAAQRWEKGDDVPYGEWLRDRIQNPLVHQIADSFCGWALSVSSWEVPTREFFSIVRNITHLKGPGIPKGGCKGVTDALVEGIRETGGEVRCKEKVTKIAVESGRATGLTAGDRWIFDAVISDIGPKATVALCGPESFEPAYRRRIEGIREAAGIKISVACDRAMIGHSGVLFTPEAQRVDGINEVTQADPDLAPPGKHLLMSHQTLQPGRDVKTEIGLGLKDLRALFPDFQTSCRVLMTQVYRGRWPVNRAISGELLRPASPVEGLYYVGDAIKPQGYMETEGVAAGVEEVLREIGRT